MTDDHLIRVVMADKSATQRELELAKRLFRLQQALDDADELVVDIITYSDNARRVQ